MHTLLRTSFTCHKRITFEKCQTAVQAQGSHLLQTEVSASVILLPEVQVWGRRLWESFSDPEKGTNCLAEPLYTWRVTGHDAEIAIRGLGRGAISGSPFYTPYISTEQCYSKSLCRGIARSLATFVFLITQEGHTVTKCQPGHCRIDVACLWWRTCQPHHLWGCSSCPSHCVPVW